MIEAGQYPIQVRRGDTGTWQFIIQDVDASDPENIVVTPIDVSDWDFTGVVKYDQSTIWFVLPIKKVDPTKGIIQFYIDKETSKVHLLPVGTDAADSAKYEIQVEIPNIAENRTEVATILEGDFNVTRDLVRDEDDDGPNPTWQFLG